MGLSPGGVDAADGRGLGGGGGASPAGYPKGKQLLPELRPEHAGRKCIVIDLDETLVHSSFKVRFKSKSKTFLQLSYFILANK